MNLEKAIITAEKTIVENALCRSCKNFYFSNKLNRYTCMNMKAASMKRLKIIISEKCIFYKKDNLFCL